MEESELTEEEKAFAEKLKSISFGKVSTGDSWMATQKRQVELARINGVEPERGS